MRLRTFVQEGEAIGAVGGAPMTRTFDGGTMRDQGTVFGSAGCND